ncbi:conserved hypothetical protein [Histoplasma capsulatum var. duboisii H88]|uniref:Uncharacterized protein n=1 Tax=Ajellomyces capsulatus (strain H88) TaxID=544711 RepID=F0US43_AJEC8|nr:conserved hypothetical protein [Histoplasma capsulatum var. duboisii H88]
MSKYYYSQVISSNDDGTINESFYLNMNSGSDCRYETELTEPDSDVPCNRHRGKYKCQQLHYRLSTSVFKKIVAAAATNNSDDNTDLKNNTDNKILSEDENNNYSSDLAKKYELNTQKKKKTSVDLKVSLQQNSSSRLYLPTVEFHYRFTKKHLSLTLINTFILSEIIYKPSLILSLYNFLFDILFFFSVFKAINLTSIEKLRELIIRGSQQQKSILLKSEMINHYIFCKITKEGELIDNTEQNLILKHASIYQLLAQQTALTASDECTEDDCEAGFKAAESHSEEGLS